MNSIFLRFKPYIRHFANVRWSFAIAILCGMLYGAASGGLLPLASRNVFPLLFHSEEASYFSGTDTQRPGASLSLEVDGVYRVGGPLYSAPQAEGRLDPDIEIAISNDQFVLLEASAGGALPAELWIQSGEDWLRLQPQVWFLDENGVRRRRLGTNGLLWTVALLPLAFLLRGAAGFANVYFINYAGLKVLEAIRLDLFAKFQTLPIGFFKAQSQGDLLSRLFNDTQQLRQSLLMVANDAVKQPFTLLFAVAFVVYESVRTKELAFALLSLGVIMLSVIPIRAIGKGVLKKAKRMQHRTGSATAVAQENLRAYSDVRAYGLAERERQRFAKEIRGIFRERMKIVKYNGLISPTVEILSAIGVSAAIVSASQSGLTLEKFAPIALALYMAYEPLKKLGAMNNNFKKGIAALERLEETMEAESESDTHESPSPSPPQKPNSIRFESVTFTYTQGAAALDGVHLELRRGESVALVGPSGAGKSTLAHLIPRFYTADSGRLTVDGMDVRQFRLEEWRQRIAVVSQTPFIFRGSLIENIGIGRLDADEEAIREAARLAHVEPFARELPEGYHTLIGDDGATLSGGQRQRIALARAFLRDAPIVILDEATSALDASSEAIVSQTIGELFRNRIGIMIAHRMSSIRIADRIVVMDGGRIVGDGPHDVLYQECGLYRALHDQQTRSS